MHQIHHNIKQDKALGVDVIQELIMFLEMLLYAVWTLWWSLHAFSFS